MVFLWLSELQRILPIIFKLHGLLSEEIPQVGTWTICVCDADAVAPPSAGAAGGSGSTPGAWPGLMGFHG